MTKLLIVLLAGGIALLSSCTEKVRKPVPPPSSEYSNMPFNAPPTGTGAGALGPLMEGR